jgi:hypothetical protein
MVEGVVMMRKLMLAAPLMEVLPNPPRLDLEERAVRRVEMVARGEEPSSST